MSLHLDRRLVRWKCTSRCCHLPFIEIPHLSKLCALGWRIHAPWVTDFFKREALLLNLGFEVHNTRARCPPPKTIDGVDSAARALDHFLRSRQRQAGDSLRRRARLRFSHAGFREIGYQARPSLPQCFRCAPHCFASFCEIKSDKVEHAQTQKSTNCLSQTATEQIKRRDDRECMIPYSIYRLWLIRKMGPAVAN